MHEDRFRSTTRLPAARERLLGAVERVENRETVPVEAADGRVLATGVEVRRDVPGDDRAAMDGFAVRAAGTYDATDRSPATLDLVEGTVGPDQARQVHTGSPLPDGADGVVRVEESDRGDGRVDIFASVAPGDNVAPAGEDLAAGERIFDAGRRLRPSDLGVLKAGGHGSVPVREPPRVAVIPTGEELVQDEPGRGETVETNGLTVSRLAERWGGAASYRELVDDDERAIAEAIAAALDHDLVVTTGGTSVGERDLLPDVVADLGELLVHGIAIKPGHPVGFGVVEDTPVLLLPGYPVSCLVTAVQLLRPAVAAAAGTAQSALTERRATLSTKLASEPGVRSFARVRFTDEATVEPVRTGGAGVLSSVARADGWVVVPESVEGIGAGERVTVELWEAS